MLLTGVHTGLRVCELTGLTLAGRPPEAGPHLRCHGKSRKDRCTPLTSNTVKVLKIWLRDGA